MFVSMAKHLRAALGRGLAGVPPLVLQLVVCLQVVYMLAAHSLPQAGAAPAEHPVGTGRRVHFDNMQQAFEAAVREFAHGDLTLLRQLASAAVCSDAGPCAPGEVDLSIQTRAVAGLAAHFVVEGHSHQAIDLLEGHERMVAVSLGSTVAPTILNNLCVAFRTLGRHDTAIRHCRRAVLKCSETGGFVSSNDDHGVCVSAQINLGGSLADSGILDEAERVLRQAADGETDSARARLELAKVMSRLGRGKEAATEFALAVAEGGSSQPAAVAGLASTVQQFGSTRDALPHYERALAMCSDKVSQPTCRSVVTTSLMNLVQAYGALGQPSDALEHGARYLKVAESTGEEDSARIMGVRASMMKVRRQIADWQDHEYSVAYLAHYLDDHLAHGGAGDVIGAFDTLFLDIPGGLRCRNAAAASHSVANQAMVQWLRGTVSWPSTNRVPLLTHAGAAQLRLAFLCHDFVDHPAGHMVREVVAADPGNFWSLAVDYGGSDGSEVRQRIVRGVSEFLDAKMQSLPDLVAAVRDREVHIAVDLQGATYGARLELLAVRVAPIQVAFLVFPGPAGDAFIDYTIADRIVVPPEHRRCYAEKLVLLPRTYVTSPYLFNVDLSGDPDGRLLQRRAAQLPGDERIVFANFNHAGKHNPRTYDAWIQVLTRSKGSVLWIFGRSAARVEVDNDVALLVQRLKSEAAARGVHPSRIVVAPTVPKADHVRRQRLADLFLDSLVYGAHSTATDALRGGLPVITALGDSFASRNGASQLNALRMSHMLVTHSVKDMVDVAVRVTASRRLLQHLRGELLRQIDTAGSVFDDDLFVEEFHRACRALWGLASALTPAPGREADAERRHVVCTHRTA